MADVYDSIGSALASAELEVAKAIGKRFLLSHRGAANVTLWGIVTDLELGMEEMNRGRRRAETGGIAIRIPVQTGFAVMTTDARSITIDDRITFPYDGERLWYVQSPVKLEANGYVAVITAMERKTKDFGPTS